MTEKQKVIDKKEAVLVKPDELKELKTVEEVSLNTLSAEVKEIKMLLLKHIGLVERAGMNKIEAAKDLIRTQEHVSKQALVDSLPSFKNYDLRSQLNEALGKEKDFEVYQSRGRVSTVYIYIGRGSTITLPVKIFKESNKKVFIHESHISNTYKLGEISTKNVIKKMKEIFGERVQISRDATNYGFMIGTQR